MNTRTVSRGIVYGTDLSERARACGEVAAEWTRRINEPLILVHVMDPALTEAAERSALQQKLESEAAHLRTVGTWVETELVSGDPSEELVKAAEIANARLLIVSNERRSRAGGGWLGRVAERCSEITTLPLLVINNPEDLKAGIKGDRSLRVLVACDLGSREDVALQWIPAVPWKDSCELGVAYVYWPPSEGQRLGIPVTAASSGATAELEAHLKKELQDKVQKALGDRKAALHVVAGWGRPDAHLLQLAGTLHSDLIVVGTNQRRGLGRLRLGSVSHGVVHHAGTNVMVIPCARIAADAQQRIPAFERVLIATDLSQLGDLAVPYAYASIRPGAEVKLIHVLDDEWRDDVVSSQGGESPLERAQKKLQSLIPSESVDRGIRTECEVLRSRDIPAAISQEAERFRADLVCLGSHGRGGWSKALMGSVSEAVMQRCRRPILLVRLPQP